jgi:hypothetical protein
MKKIGLTISIIALISAFATAQDFSVSAIYGFKAMGCWAEKSPPIVDCPNGSTNIVTRKLTKLLPANKSILVSFPLNKRWSLAIGYQENIKGFPLHAFDGNITKDVTEGEYRGITVGFQYNFTTNKRLVCHLNSYFSPELRLIFNGISNEVAKEVNVSYSTGVGVDVKIWRSFYWTTNVFGETALMHYKRDKTGDFTFVPVAFGINSGLQMKF